MQVLYSTAKQLSNTVIPHEYGLDPQSKLSIGSKIAKELVGKLCADLCAMRCVLHVILFQHSHGIVLARSQVADKCLLL